MNAAARKLVDQRFGAMRRVAEKALADAEVRRQRSAVRDDQENMAALAAAQATADALVIAHGIALGVIPVR